MEVSYTCILAVYSTNDFCLFKVDWTDTQISKSTMSQCLGSKLHAKFSKHQQINLIK